MKAPTRIAFILAAAFAIVLGFFAYEPYDAGRMFSRFGYWNILVCSLLFCGIALKIYRIELRDWLSRKENGLMVVSALMATVFVYSIEGGGIKITFDERAISQVAKLAPRDNPI
ncbi:MAG: hypothetical protein CBD18_03795 [Opitutales bacterium TMED158]|nr:MAG: hypothetical protein CBD18_03795 [Opitutales bacterium TMED158]